MVKAKKTLFVPYLVTDLSILTILGSGFCAVTNFDDEPFTKIITPLKRKYGKPCFVGN